MKLSVIAPAFNEAEGIQYFLTELRDVLNNFEFPDNEYEVIIVNDGSSDSTKEKVLSFGWKQVCLINLMSNSGHMAALEAGIAKAKGDLVVTMDSDLQHPPKFIIEMVRIQNETSCDVVIGVRIRGAESSWLRRTLSSNFYRLLSKISKVEVHVDAQDFRLMTNRVVATLNSLPEISKVYRFLIGALGFEVRSISYFAPERKYGKSKYSLMHLWRLAVNGVIGFSTFPLSAIFAGGVAIFLISIAYIFFIVINIKQSSEVPGWTSLMLTFLSLSSLQFISIGIMGRYISQILSEVRRRPNYLIESIYVGENKSL
jgi:dolichol-phosphate mannosyltransferase